MRLLFVTQDFPPDVGGIQTYCHEVAPRLAQRCDQFLLVAPSRPGDAEVDASLSFPVRRLTTRPDLLGLRALPSVLRLARRHAFDVALHVQWQTAYASFLARALTGAPHRVAVTLHGRDTVFNPFSRSLFQKGYDALRRGAVGRADHILPVSHFLAHKAQTLGAAGSQINVVQNGTNPEVFYPEPAPKLRAELNAEGRPLVLSAGRLVPKKGFDTALQALNQVREEVPEVLLLVAGDGPERASLDRLVHTLGLEQHVRFLGTLSQEQLRRYYSLADVFLMTGRAVPNDIEGFGLVYLEANACGTPVIGARVGGIPDAIQHGETGLLVPPDDPSATATALTDLLTTPDLARRLGKQGLERVRATANWDHVANRLWTVLRNAHTQETPRRTS